MFRSTEVWLGKVVFGGRLDVWGQRFEKGHSKNLEFRWCLSCGGVLETESWYCVSHVEQSAQASGGGLMSLSFAFAVVPSWAVDGL
jgi:hypothetical protein